MSLHPHFNLKYALEGRIVKMDAQNTVINRGRVFVEDGLIVDIRPINGGYPMGFSRGSVIKSGGTIFPGLMELHNHLPYNILPFWVSERRFDNRGQWSRIRGYKTNVQGPMQTLGKTPGFPEAIVKYVECKSLVGGVTTSQGVTLANSRIRKKFFHGAIRNVEETNEASLPEVMTRIGDVTGRAGEAAAFKNRLSDTKTTLLHLSEGVDERANSFFQNLKISDNNWAITNKLNGIHCTGLNPEDFEIMASYGGTMTWSPFSNILLYGGTADIKAAKDNGILIALGSDWSPSGSKNLLEEIKVAKEVSNHQGGVFSNIELVQMATINPAKILGWDQMLGSIEVGKKADFVVINGYNGDPYNNLIEATERNIYGAFINGVPRYAISRIMSYFSSKFNFNINDIEEIEISGTKRKMYTLDADPDGILNGIKYTNACDLLKSGLQNISELARDLEQASANGILSASDNPLDLEWFIAPDLDHDHGHGHLDTDSGDIVWGATEKYSDIAIPLPLDGLSVIDDDEHFSRLRNQPNLPDYLRENLPAYYSRPALGSYQESFIPSNDIHKSLNLAVSLEVFKKRSSNLSNSQKLLILNQSRILINQIYVHKVLKQSLYAVNPIQRLDKIINDIKFNLNELYNDDNYFHSELLKIFSSLRDLHTKYYLPYPYRSRFAFLPFLIEEYYEFENDVNAKFIVTKTFDTIVAKKAFKKGVEILFWNNIPIERIVELNAITQSGSNQDAQRARSIDTLTIRSLGASLPPDENLVRLTCRDVNGAIFNVEYEWMTSFYPPHFSLQSTNDIASSLAYGCDFDTLTINNVKFGFYVGNRTKNNDWIWPPNNQNMKGKLITSDKGERVGYIRIFNFSTDSETEFVNQFLHVLDELKQQKIAGLIIDIRGNGGGRIPACELLLAKLSGKKFKPQSFQFLSSGLTLNLTSLHSKNKGLIDFSPWNDSLKKSNPTGELYSLGNNISKFKESDHSKEVFIKPMILITDALCYSAADMFAAGFQDLKIGKILGVHGNTGAGGANVWSHQLIYILMSNNQNINNPFTPLPNGADLTIAVRRSLRANGYPLEDLGVRPDFQHRMTKDDILNGNKDLIATAIRKLLAK
jgi:C-terminal processing protease CtpA/Prc